ncbi:MAG: type II secretion system protein GspK [Syntrophales bacterium]|nr:type II secretion system protein GspK [Syntrophales bacterium]
MKRIFYNNRGIALIVVILMVSVIVGLTVELNRATRDELYSAANLSDGIRLYYIAKSGFNGGEALLMEDANNFDALTEDWAKMELLSQQSEAYFRQGSFLVRIEDETGKIPINKMVAAGAQNKPAKNVDLNTDSSVKGLLIRLLSLPDFKLDKDRVYEIVDSIQDWLDADDTVTDSGAENSYYRTLGYSCKNGLLDCMDELLMIKGVSKELYFGTKETPALKDCLTLYGEGKININTAPRLVLRALSGEISPEIAEKMDKYRKTEGNDLADVNWYRKIPALSTVTLSDGLLSVKSSYFTVISMGILGKMKETVTGTVKKGQERGAAELLSWNVE